jgi:hypothetical protein
MFQVETCLRLTLDNTPIDPLGAQGATKKPTRSPTPTRPTGTASRPVSATPTAPAEPAVMAKPTPLPAPEPAVSMTGADKPASDAQAGERVRVGLEAGMAAPMSSLGRAFSVGFTAGGFLQGRPDGFPVSLRGDLQYSRFGGQNTVVTPSYSVIQLTGAGVYEFPKAGGSKSPFFASAGLGLYRSAANNESQTDFGQNLGLGFNFKAQRFKPFVEGRFHFFNDVQFFTLTAAVHL